MKFNQQLVINITKNCNIMMLVKSSSHKSISKLIQEFHWFATNKSSSKKLVKSHQRVKFMEH